MTDWLLSDDSDAFPQLDEDRRAARLCGQGQLEVQACIAEAYSPVRVTGTSEKTGILAGFAVDIAARDKFGNPWD